MSARIRLLNTLYVSRVVLAASFVLSVSSVGTQTAVAQAPSAATATRQLGTVKVIAGNNITMTTDAGQQMAITVTDGARILQLAPGSTDLKSAQTIAITDIGTGDRVLVTGKSGDAPETFSANRVILMKSGDIAERHTTEQADWQKRGSGGLVSAVDASAGSITISSGAKKILVQTTPQTVFRRYANDSVKFQDAKHGTLAEIRSGDQLEVRGAKSEDGTSIQAEEVVSGSFRNLSGTLLSVNAASSTITLKDLASKKLMTISFTPNSDIRKLPAEAAARFAARARGGASGTAEAVPASTAAQPTARSGGAGSNYGAQTGAARSAGMDLSRLLARLPSSTVADLHTGDAVMIVASEAAPGSDKVTAVTLLSGVEPILSATPSGSQAVTLSPWNVGGGAPEGGGGAP